MKNTRLTLLKTSGVIALGLLSQGCNSSSVFSPISGTALSVSGASASSSSSPIVCSPFGKQNEGASEKNGLSAHLTYLPTDGKSVTSYSTGGYANVTPNTFDPSSADAASDLVSVSSQIILNNVNVPTIDFTQGFLDLSGQALMSTSGQKLTSYFSLHLDADLMLNPGDIAGDYQFATLTDDGANTYLDNSPLITDPAPHSAMMACALRTIHLVPGVSHKFHMDWYQGPPRKLANMLFWRLNPSDLSDPDCTTAGRQATYGNDEYYFTMNGANPVATTSFTNFSPNRGWKVVPASNFYLPNNQTNPCAGN